MSVAIVSLWALLGAILLSMVSRINVGVIAIAAAWIVGVYIAGDKPDAVIDGFPAALFLTLAGVTLLFAVGETNQSFATVTAQAMRLTGGNRRLIPLLFFVVAAVVAGVGPGAIASVALVVPLAAVIGRRADIPPMLTALMVANGANSLNLSPISSVGIIANSSMAKAGLVGHEAAVMGANFWAHVIVSAVVYLWYFRKLSGTAADADTEAAETPRVTRAQGATLFVLLCWIVAVTVFKANVGLAAFAAAALLIAIRAGDERAVIKAMPWNVILMVCGVSLLVALVENHGGTELFSRMIAAIASPATINGVIAFVTGAISVYSSTSGVVLPAFLPTVPAIVQSLGGGNPLEVALSINVGSSLVDVSPLSTLGALCVAALAKDGEGRKLFTMMLVWGFAMTLVGAIIAMTLVPLLV
jgi:di/tricarboxylate transporter